MAWLFIDSILSAADCVCKWEMHVWLLTRTFSNQHARILAGSACQHTFCHHWPYFLLCHAMDYLRMPDPGNDWLMSFGRCGEIPFVMGLNFLYVLVCSRNIKSLGNAQLAAPSYSNLQIQISCSPLSLFLYNGRTVRTELCLCVRWGHWPWTEGRAHPAAATPSICTAALSPGTPQLSITLSAISISIFHFHDGMKHSVWMCNIGDFCVWQAPRFLACSFDCLPFFTTLCIRVGISSGSGCDQYDILPLYHTDRGDNTTP